MIWTAPFLHQSTYNQGHKTDISCKCTKILINCRQMHRDVTNNARSNDTSLKISMNKYLLIVVKQDITRHTFYRCKKKQYQT